MHTQQKNLLATSRLSTKREKFLAAVDADELQSNMLTNWEVIKWREKLLTTIEAAKFLDVQPNTLAVWRLTKRYPLPYIRIGRLIKYRVADLEDYIALQRQNIQPEKTYGG